MPFLDAFLAGKQVSEQRRRYNDQRNFHVIDALSNAKSPSQHKALQQAFYSGGYVGEDDEGRLGVSQENYVNNSANAEARRDFTRNANRYAYDARDGKAPANNEEVNQIFANRNAVQDAERRGVAPSASAQQGYNQFLGDYRERPDELAKKVAPKQKNFLQTILGAE